jgi:hypothetical protein
MCDTPVTGKLIGDHIIRHAFDDMKGYESENIIKSEFMIKEIDAEIS